MDRWTDRLSAYLDDEMGGEERAALDEHLADCPECRETLADLRRIVERARALEPQAPAADLWPTVLERIQAGPDVVPIGVRQDGARTGRFAFTGRQLVAAGLALLLTGAATSWFAFSGLIGSPPAAPVTTAAALPQDAQAPGVLASDATPAAIESRITELEALLGTAHAELDPQTIAVIRKNLAIVQAAVDEAERALAADPANEYLRAHLQNTLRSKVDVLERVATLAET